MDFRWSLVQQPVAESVTKLSKELSITDSLAKLLIQRGITTFEDAKTFFRPSLDQLHDPFLMKDMEKAIVRIEQAFGNGERIMVYGDYDVDGTTAVSLVYSFFSKFYDNIEYYIPDRYVEGYGISYKGIDVASENNVALIIALDCGIKAVEKVAYAKEKGIDFIICDHHRPGDELPNAVAVLDPKQNDCSYPFDELCGCGIGFKLVQAWEQKNNSKSDKLESYFDLAAISIASDIVPIIGENRVLAHYGLQLINSNPRTGIKSMLELADVKKKQLTITDLVFIIGPRINAAGRIDHAKKAVQLLVSNNENDARETSKLINNDNLNRKDIDKKMTEEALQMIADDNFLSSSKSCVLFNPKWHKGVVGIVASRVIESYYRPTIILTESGNLATGSARSVKDFDVYNAIDACSDLLEQFGGHKYAAGLTLKTENVDEFRQRFNEVVSRTIKDEQLIPQLEIDAELHFSEITPKFYRILQQFAPFGPGNMRPTFITKAVLDTGNTKTVGGEGAHLKLSVYQKGNLNIRMDGIAFNFGHLHKKIVSGIPFDIAYTLDENVWNGNATIQLKIKDIRF